MAHTADISTHGIGAMASTSFTFKHRQVKDERRPDDLDRDNRPFVNFFGEGDEFMWMLKVLPLLSSTHSSCVRSKVNYSVGNGFNINQGNGNVIFAAWRKMVEALGMNTRRARLMMDYAKRVNDHGENLLTVTEQIFRGQYWMGNSFLHLRKFKAGKKDFLYLYATDPTKCRLRKAGTSGRSESVYVGANWNTDFVSRHFTSEKYNEQYFSEIPLYPRWGKHKGADVTTIHIKEPAIGYDYYGLNSSVASMFDQFLEYYIPHYNVTEFRNGFMPNAFIQFISDMNRKQARTFLRKFYQGFIGDGKQNGIFAQVVKHPDLAAKIEYLKKDFDGSFGRLREDAAQSIITSHQWHPGLAGIATPGKLGDTQELVNAYLIAMANVIVPTQNRVMSQVNNALNEGGFDGVHLSIANAVPITFYGKLEPSQVMMINEQREVMGLQALEDQEIDKLLKQRPYTSRRSRNNSSGNTSQEDNPDQEPGQITEE